MDLSKLKTRLFFITLNYPETSHYDGLKRLLHSDSVDYFCWGTDKCDKHHLHYHVLFHCKNPRFFSSIVKIIGKQPHLDYPVKDVSLAIDYCKGYRDGKLKCVGCGSQAVEWGIPPINGVNKTTEKVISAIKSGYTIDKLNEEFPSYMIHHAPKVKNYIDSIKPKHQTSFYYIYDFPGYIKDIKAQYPDAAFVQDITHLESFPSYDTVVLASEYKDYRTFELWSSGFPIVYKYGYQSKMISPKNLIIVLGESWEIPEGYSKFKILIKDICTLEDTDVIDGTHLTADIPEDT